MAGERTAEAKQQRVRFKVTLRSLKAVAECHEVQKDEEVKAPKGTKYGCRDGLCLSLLTNYDKVVGYLLSSNE